MRPFAYAILRVVPRVERGERLNAGVVVFCRQDDFLAARTKVDEVRLAALAPELEPRAIRERLAVLEKVAEGSSADPVLSALPRSGRFGWMIAPSSTIVQASEVHTGLTEDPAETLARLFTRLVS